MEGKRIVVTGLGVYTPLGLNINEFWESLINGKTVIRNIADINPLFKTSRVQIGSLFYKEQMDPEKLGMGKDAKHRTSHFTKIAFSAAREAVNDSGIFSNESNADEIKKRTGISVGGGFGGISDIEKASIVANEKGLGNIDRFIAPKTIPGAAAAYIANYYQIHAGDAPSIITECASGASNIIYGYMFIKLGLANAWIAGGTGDAFSILTLGGFDRIGALYLGNLDAERASRPFDRDRNGFVIGDGAGIVVLEELEHARKRGARIYAELLGFGATLDGDHPTSPREDAEYSTLAIKQALEMSKLNKEQIDYINSHGTSTKDNDRLESKAIKQAFEEHAYKISINSTKSMTGHTLNASGALEAIVTLKTIETGIIHPTKNLENPDVEQGCDLDYTMGNARERKINYAISNSFAFGGRNVVLCFGRYMVREYY